MKAVILAAGRGGRMGELTKNTPKPLLKVNGKPILEHILESLPPEIDEVIIAVKYLAAQIKKHLGDEFHGRRIKYVAGSAKGSAYSFLAAKPHLNNERFLVVQGDEIPHADDIIDCLKKNLSVLAFESDNPQAHGIGYLRKDGSLSKIVEKPKQAKSKLGINGVHVLNTNIFNYAPILSRGEFYFSTLIGMFARDHKVFPVMSRQSIRDVNTLNDLTSAEKVLSSLKTQQDSLVN